MREVQAGHIVRPIDPNSMPEFQISGFGVISKSAQRCRPLHGWDGSPWDGSPWDGSPWRLILDLSHPEHFSINDGIDPRLCSLAYPTVHDAVQQVLKLGCRALLAKINIEQAFRNVPVHPQDRHLLCMMWSDQLFYRHSTAIWFKIRSQNLPCNCRCPGVDPIQTWDILLFTLLG